MVVNIFQRNPIAEVNQVKEYIVVQNPLTVNVETEVVMSTTAFRSFTFTATEGQTEFVLDDAPVSIVLLAINGTVQDQKALDFTFLGDTITLDEGVDAGDFVYGVYQLR